MSLLSSHPYTLASARSHTRVHTMKGPNEKGVDCVGVLWYEQSHVNALCLLGEIR